MYKQKNKKGISLIVLIIVIVVMTILATVVILIANGGNIRDNANKAVNSNNTSKAKEVVMMAKAKWRTDKEQISERGFATLKRYAESELEEQGFVIGNNAGEVLVTESGTLYEYKEPVIPKGFVASDLENEDEVSEGLVIYEGSEKVSADEDADTTRNQFVWIPVPSITEFILTEGYSNGNKQTHVMFQEVNEPYLFAKTHVNDIKSNTGEYSEYNAMMASIEKYGGFYVGRYESGTTNARTDSSNGTSLNADTTLPDVLVQKNKYIYNYVGWGISMTEVSGDIVDNKETNEFNQGQGAVMLSRNLYSNDNIISHLLYGVEWDAISRFIDNEDFLKNSSSYGNYTNYNESVKQFDKVEDVGNLKKSGFSDFWKQKNIYDLAGNAKEWTMEAFSGAVIGRTVRGGCATDSGKSNPISNRIGYSTTYNEEMLGFRVALYLK